MIKHICKNIFRAPGKSLLGLMVALTFTLALGILQNTIADFEQEITRIYAETVVNAEIRLDPFAQSPRVRRVIGDVVPMIVVQEVL